MIQSLIQVLCLFRGMYYLFNGNKRWKWISASTVVLAVVNMIRL